MFVVAEVKGVGCGILKSSHRNINSTQDSEFSLNTMKLV